ncbi:hypothetical protein HS088_TW04G00029 [Tripterygium wilfordii]|uniref:Transcriptional coactivator Hfi1/Transcriptional adapter 1 n=1 Tax=Tripterygium wilfordii TaxID=458696 RepID=A0A7J7DNZ1_TRIWF|nr:uncharacterized protein LOC119996114 [Tripterygium wilfordii]KAF5748080.1 hypothetical protein HS088_TW04G00029 [Tripterygium wilfordii]
MQPHQSSRVDLGELKAQIVKKIGVDRSKRYFYNLNRFLSQKLSKSEFDKSYYRVLGRENLPLHNQLIRTILKNASHAKTPPPFHEVGPAKTLIQTAKASPSKEDGHEQSGSLIPAQNQNVHIWSNGVLPVSPRKGRSGIRDRKLRDRPSPLGPNGKVDVVHHSTGTEDNGSKGIMENGELIPCDYQRPLQLLQPVAEAAEQPENEKEHLVTRTSEKTRIGSIDHSKVAVVEDGEEVEQGRYPNFSKRPLVAPPGIPFYSASVGGARKAIPVASSGKFFSCYDSGGLSDTETLRKRMEQIATSQGIGGVSLECANTLNNMLDVYLKRLIRSCVQLVGGRSAQFAKQGPTHKQQVPGKIINGIWPSNHLHMQSSGEPVDCMQEKKSRCSISLLDFKVAMELNPQQLGEDWPLLLEKICMQSCEE